MGVKVKEQNSDPGAIVFFCPGCGHGHRIYVAPGPSPRPVWGYNGNPERPTFTPSVLARGTKMTAKGEAEYKAWMEAGRPQRNAPFESEPEICHSFVTDGKIQFLTDSTHALAGQTVELPDFDEAVSANG